MKEITVATRKYLGETYTFILNIPSYDGETGCLGIEINPYITVETPENCFGYADYFHYDRLYKTGHYSWRYHPAWITKKIIETCNRNCDKWLKEYYYKPKYKNDYPNRAALYAERYNVAAYRIHGDKMTFTESNTKVIVDLNDWAEKRVNLN